MAPNPYHQEQVKQILKNKFFSFILPRNDKATASWNAEQHEKNRLSRSLAASAIQSSTGISYEAASACVIDGFEDNGIDGICFHEESQTLVVTQAKLNSAPSLDDTNTFISGIKNIYQGHYPTSPELTEAKKQAIKKAMEGGRCKVLAVLVYTGQSLSSHALEKLRQFKTERNQHHQHFDFKELNATELFSYYSDLERVSLIDVEINFYDWGLRQTSQRILYGTVKAMELAALFAQHDKALLQKNIRHYLGDTPVNKAISKTAHDSPDFLSSLNNGITAVCEKITVPNVSVDSHGLLKFPIKGFSIVNGAQTVSSLHTANEENPLSEEAEVLVTVIEVETEELSIEITKARNTQNVVQTLAYAALDPNQDRIAREFTVAGYRYFYRPNDESAEDGRSYFIEDAIYALGSFRGSMDTVVALKRDLTSVQNVDGAHYKRLFTDQVTATEVGRAINLYSAAEDLLIDRERSTDISSADEENYKRQYFTKLCYRHGRYFILNMLARKEKDFISAANLVLSAEDITTLSEHIDNYAHIVIEEAFKLFGADKGPLAIFRNIGYCRELEERVVPLLFAQPAAVPVTPSLTGDLAEN